jgi:hypothetical protein
MSRQTLPPIHKRAGKWAEQNARQHTDKRCDGEHGAGASCGGEPPDQSELGDLAVKQRKGLADPDREENTCPGCGVALTPPGNSTILLFCEDA